MRDLSEPFLRELAAALGLHVAVSAPYAAAWPAVQAERADTAARRTLYLARDPAQLVELVDLEKRFAGPCNPVERRRLRHELGRAYGYPPCCVAAFERYEAMRLDAAFLLAVAEATVGPFRGGCNKRPPGAPLQHVPCSFSCASTATASQRALEGFLGDGERLRTRFGTLASGGTVPDLDASVLDDLLAVLPDARTTACRSLLDAPMLYVDWTRYLIWLDGRAECVDSDSQGETWRIHGGRLLTSGALLGARLPEERGLHADLQRTLVAPLLAQMAAGPLTIRQPRAGTGEGVRIGALQATAHRWRLLPFGTA